MESVVRPAVTHLVQAHPSGGVSVAIDREGRPALRLDAETVRSIASVGKLILLAEVARRLEAGEVGGGEPLRRTDEDAVADSGLWQHLGLEALTVLDACALIGGVSDNLATNVLLRHVGLPAVAAAGEALGLRSTVLLDRSRDIRLPSDPPRLASGSAAELVGLIARIARDELPWPGVGARIAGWLRLNTDLSMVAAAFGFDPLAHVEPDRGLSLVNKTGTNRGVRVDVGSVATSGRTVDYAVLAAWDDVADPGARDAVLATMRAIGDAIRIELTADR